MIVVLQEMECFGFIYFIHDCYFNEQNMYLYQIFYTSPKNTLRGEMSDLKLKILNIYGKSGKSTNDGNAPVISVMVFVWFLFSYHMKQ